MAYDHVADRNGAELYRLAQQYEFPDFVKQADMAETLRPTDLPASVYADPRTGQRAFPCHNPASTWLSALYFAEKQAEYHPKDRARIQARLDHFVNYWSLKQAVDAIRARWAELHKNADDRLPDSDFALVWVGEDGSKQRHLRMKSAAETLAAADWLSRYRDQLPFADRNTVAVKILEKAAAYGAGLGALESFVEKQAGQGLCDPKEVVAMLQNRAKLARDAKTREGVLKLAEQVQKQPAAALTPDMLVKLASTVDSVDRALHLVGRYSDVLPRPEDVIFKVTLKEAQAGVGAAVAMTTGRIYDKTAFTKLSLDDLKGLFGADFAGQVADGLNVDAEKLAEMAATMPRDDAELFEKLLNEAGIPPIHHKAASDRRGIGFDVLRRFARHY